MGISHSCPAQVAAAASLGLCCVRADGTAPLPAAVALVAGCAAAAGAGGDDAFVGPAAAYLAWAWASPTMTWPHRFALLGCVGLRYALGGSRCGGRFGDLFAASFRDSLKSATARAAKAPLEDLGEDELLQASLLNYVAELWDAPSAGDFNVITAVLEAVAAFGAGAAAVLLLVAGLALCSCSCGSSDDDAGKVGREASSPQSPIHFAHGFPHPKSPTEVEMAHNPIGKQIQGRAPRRGTTHV